MALESANYIDGLVSTNPTSTDNIGDGDNHIRLLKTAIKATFPYLTGAVTPTHSEINLAVSEANSATSENTVLKTVKRDASGGFSAGPVFSTAFNGPLAGDVYSTDGTLVLQNGVTGYDAVFIGNAATASKLLAEREIAISGDITGSAVFDGTTDISIAATVVDDSHEHTISTISDLQAELDSIALNSWPIGSVYTSIDSANPSTLFGGVWQSFGAGKVLVGIDSEDTDFDTSEETGGAKTHTLTVGEMPSHSHDFTAMRDTNDSVNRTGGGDLGAPSSGTTVATGGGAAHNNIQPYIVVYMFKRTS